MATANDILNYQGNKELAFGSTALPAVSTDVVVDLTPGINYWQQYAQNKLLVAREQDAQLKRKQLKAQEDFNNLTDPSKYKFWDRDHKFAADKWAEFRKAAVEVMKSGNWDNIHDPDYVRVKAMADDLMQQAQFSAQQQINYNVGDDAFTKTPFNYKPESRASLDAYANAKSPKERAEMNYELTPNVSLDFPAYVAKLKTAINPSQKVTSRMVNGRWEDTTETFYDPNEIDAAIKVDYQTNKKFQAEADEAFAYLMGTDPEAAQAFGSAQRYASATAFDMLNGGTKQIMKNPFYPPAYTQKDDLDEIGKRKELIYRIQNKDPQALDIFRGLKYQGLPIADLYYTTEFSEKEKFIRDRDELQSQADALTGKEQKEKLAQVAAKQKQIDNTKDQAMPTIIEIITQPTSTDPDGKKIDIEVSSGTGGGFYAINQFINDLEGQQKLSVEELSKVPEYRPESQQQKSETEQRKQETGTVKVILNGKVGEIPANQWEAFKKKYPSAKKAD